MSRLKSSCTNMDEFNKLQEYTIKTVKEIAKEIFEGNIDIFAFITGSIRLKYSTPAGIKSSIFVIASIYVKSCICSPAITSSKSISFIEDL